MSCSKTYGIIGESDSEHTSRIVMVKKKTGKLRMCVDSRVINKYVEKGHHPMPIIQDIILKLYGKKYFTVLDLKTGFITLT